MSMTKEAWEQAFRDTISEEFAEIPLQEREIEYSCSEIFLKKMERLVYCQRKWSWNILNTAKKRVAMFVIVVLALFMTACSIEEIRQEFMRWYEEIYDGFEHKFELKSFKRTITKVYELTVVPEGFKEVARLAGPSSRMVGYENVEGDYIVLEQYATDEQVVFEDAEEKYIVIIEGVEIQIYEYKAHITAVWIETDDCMILTYYGCENVESVKSMIEAVR